MSLPRFFADDVLFDTAMREPAPGWTWCVMDGDTDEDLVIAVCSSRATADTIADALNKHLDREATS